MRVVVIQRKLVRALCALPAASTVDQEWLSNTAWPNVDAVWIRRFWENQKGRRQAWLKTIAAADVHAKQELLDIMTEQHAFRGLYEDPPTQRLQQTDRPFWEATPIRQAMRDLMLDFYDPWFYESAGYPSALHGNGDVLKRSHLARDPMLPVCPFSDGTMQRPQLDHFLPKEAFPFICLHPDNLIPSGSDANTIKSTDLPLEWSATDQADAWFHPRWRTARGRFTIQFQEDSGRSLGLALSPQQPVDRDRVANLQRMFALVEFWGGSVESDVQDVLKELADELRADGNPVDVDAAIRSSLARRHQQVSRGIGRWPLHMYRAALYYFVLHNDALIADIQKQYAEDMAA